MDRQTQALRRQMSQPRPAQTQYMLTYDKSNDDLFGPIVPEGGIVGGPLSFLQDAFQLGEDGKVKFHLQFDVRGYEPEHIQVKLEKNRLTVRAKKSVRTTDGRSSSEYCRMVYVPDSVDENQFECLMTADGVLVVEAPVKREDYGQIKFNQDLRLGIKPQSGPQLERLTIQEQEKSNKTEQSILQVTGEFPYSK